MAMFEELEGPHAMRPPKRRVPEDRDPTEFVARLIDELGTMADDLAAAGDQESADHIRRNGAGLAAHLGLMLVEQGAQSVIDMLNLLGRTKFGPGWDAEDVRNVPIRAKVNGRWTTVMITKAEWEAAAQPEPFLGAEPQKEDLGAERVSGPPVRRPGLLYADAKGLATPQHRPVDGPGCTPAFVPGVLRSVHAFNRGSSSVNVECLGEQCTGCSDSQCWTVRADGGDV